MFQKPPGRPSRRHDLGAEVLGRLRAGPLPSVRAVAAAVGEDPSNPATTWRTLRLLREDGLVDHLPGVGWFHASWWEVAARDEDLESDRWDGEDLEGRFGDRLGEEDLYREVASFLRALEDRTTRRPGILGHLPVVLRHRRVMGDYDLRREYLRRQSDDPL